MGSRRETQNAQRQSMFQFSIPVWRRSLTSWSRPCLLILMLSVGVFTAREVSGLNVGAASRFVVSEEVFSGE